MKSIASPPFVRRAERLAREVEQRAARRGAWADDPAGWLRDALALLALQCDARGQPRRSGQGRQVLSRTLTKYGPEMTRSSLPSPFRSAMAPEKDPTSSG